MKGRILGKGKREAGAGKHRAVWGRKGESLVGSRLQLVGDELSEGS